MSTVDAHNEQETTNVEIHNYTPTPPASDFDMSRLKDNPYLGKTRGSYAKPRPQRDDQKYAYSRGDELFAQDRDRWDAAEDWVKHNDQLRADRIAKDEADKQAAQKVRDGADAAKRTQARADLEDRLKRSFLMNPAATAADWERVKDDQIARHLSDEAARLDDQARRAQSALYQQF